MCILKRWAGGSSFHGVFVQSARSPELEPPQSINWAWWHIKRQRQKNGMLKAILAYIKSLRPAWTTRDSLQSPYKRKKNHMWYGIVLASICQLDIS